MVSFGSYRTERDAVFIRIDLIAKGEQLGHFSFIRADAPAIIGAAKEVPRVFDVLVPVPDLARGYRPPGADISGLIMLLKPGPRDENRAITPGILSSTEVVAPTENILGDPARAPLI